MRSFGTAMRTVFESRVLMLSVSIEKQDSLNFRSFSDVSCSSLSFTSIATIAARSRGAGRRLLNGIMTSLGGGGCLVG